MVEACRTSGPLNLHFAESGVRVAVDDQDTVGRPCRERAKVSHGVRVQWDAGLNFDVHVIAAAAALRSLTSWATHVILHRRKTTSPFADRHLLTHAPLQTCLLWLLQTFWRVPNKPAAPVAPRMSQDKRRRGIGFRRGPDHAHHGRPWKATPPRRGWRGGQAAGLDGRYRRARVNA